MKRDAHIITVPARAIDVGSYLALMRGAMHYMLVDEGKPPIERSKSWLSENGRRSRGRFADPDLHIPRWQWVPGLPQRHQPCRAQYGGPAFDPAGLPDPNDYESDWFEAPRPYAHFSTSPGPNAAAFVNSLCRFRDRTGRCRGATGGRGLGCKPFRCKLQEHVRPSVRTHTEQKSGGLIAGRSGKKGRLGRPLFFRSKRP